MTSTRIDPERLPFGAAIQFFRDKVNVPTRRWADLWHEQHDVGFMVAGAYKADLLTDLRAAVDRAIADGTTLERFRDDFADIVGRHGWSYRGGFGWRTRVIFETNLRTAYQAGRYRQLTDPELLKSRPYWYYKHGDSLQPRPLHLSWDGTVLPADDPWWETHYTPNGWGCKCKVFALSQRDLKRRGLSLSERPDDGTYEWVDRATGQVHRIPTGIDPGFAYAPGRSLTDNAREIAERKAAQLAAQGATTAAAQLAEEIAQAARRTYSLDELIAAGREVSDDLLAELPDPGQRSIVEPFRQQLRARLQAARDIDTPAAVANRGKGARLVQEVSRWFPDSWTAYADAHGPLHVRSTKGRGWQLTLGAGYPWDRARIGGGFGVIDAKPGAGYILTRDNAATALHEYTHRLQHVMPELDDYFQQVHVRRNEGQALRRLRDLSGAGYPSSEVSRPDGYVNPYQGREYKMSSYQYSGRAGALEVMTMAFQHLLADGEREFLEFLAKDRELFDLVVGTLMRYEP